MVGESVDVVDVGCGIENEDGLEVVGCGRCRVAFSAIMKLVGRGGLR